MYNTAPQYEVTEMFRFAVPRENVFKNGSDPVRIFLKQCSRARKWPCQGCTPQARQQDRWDSPHQEDHGWGGGCASQDQGQ